MATSDFVDRMSTREAGLDRDIAGPTNSRHTGKYQARIAGAHFAVWTWAGAATLGQGYHGTAKLVVDAERGVIVGATFVGPGTGELLHAATVSIVAEVPLDTLCHAVPAFPILSEVWLRLAGVHRDEFDHEFV